MKPFLASMFLSVLAHALLVWLLGVGFFRSVTSALPSPEFIAIEFAALQPEQEEPPREQPVPPPVQMPVLPIGSAPEPLPPEPATPPEDQELDPLDPADFSGQVADEGAALLAEPTAQEMEGTQGREPRLPVSGVLAVQAYLGRYALDGDPLGKGELWVEFPRPDRYRLRLWAKAEGWAAIFVREPVVFESLGRIDEQGLRPELYRQQTPFRGLSESHFDADSKTAVLEKGQAPQELPDDFQDRLSIIFQLSWLSQLNPESLQYGGTTEITIAGRRRFIDASFRADRPEDIVLPGGIVVTAVRLVSERLQSNRDGQIEIWLDTADQNLPVRILFSEPSGRAVDFLVIRDVFNKPSIDDPAAFNPQ